jgi:hypothetical protein
VCSVMMMPGTPSLQFWAVRRYSLRLSWAKVQSCLSGWRWRRKQGRSVLGIART